MVTYVCLLLRIYPILVLKGNHVFYIYVDNPNSHILSVSVWRPLFVIEKTFFKFGDLSMNSLVPIFDLLG